MTIEVTPGTFTFTLYALFQKGVRYSTVIDVGCADGHYYLTHHALGLFPEAVPLNIDANVLYEDSLKAIKDALGGDYFIGAVAERDGELEMTSAAHPYWSSLVPEDHPYWRKINRLSGTKSTVQAATLDALAERFALRAPYLLKLDVQGGELGALRGATKLLEGTDVVICEADLDDFDAIHAFLTGRGFFIYDLTLPAWLPDGSLGWFYPVYLHPRLRSVKRESFWDREDNDATLRKQVERRRFILQQNAEYLAQLGPRKPR